MSLSVTSNYAGKAAADIIAPAILSGKTLSGKYVKIYTGIKDKFNIPVGTSTVAIQSYACESTPDGTFTLTEKVLDLKKGLVHVEACFDTLRTTFESENQQAGSANDVKPTASIQAWIEKDLKDKTALAIDQTIWRGSVVSGADFDGVVTGFYPALVASSTNIDVAGTSITASNVMAEIQKVVNAIPETEIDKAYLYVTYAIARAYIAALPLANPYMFSIKEADANLMFQGIPMRIVNLPSNKMVATDPNNLIFGTDLESDFNSFKSGMVSNSGDTVFYKATFKLDTQIVNDPLIVLYN